jgi:eukaryotic-like serine/threonine-protein kinase
LAVDRGPSLLKESVTLNFAASGLTAALADRYRVERELGAGGMATVYLAQDLKHDRLVAIKVLRPELAAVIGAERFLAEIRTTANLQHPHILPLFDSGVAQVEGPSTALYYVMPFVEGESLRDRLNREKQLPVADAVRIAGEVASALDYAHRHNVVHRDIKPENILLHDGRALVADFGIALAASRAGGTRMTETGMSLGTPTYMSPEQAMGEREITARSDVYALGCVTYEMLLGEPPFTGPTAQSIVAKVMTADPASLTAQRKSIPPQVEAAVFTALEKLPADRQASAAEFAAALTAGTDGTPPVSRARNFPIPGSRSRSLVPAAWTGIALLLAAAAGWTGRAISAPATEGEPVEFAFRLGNGGGDRPYLAISNDGRRIAQVVADSVGVNRVFLRDLGSTVLTVVPGTEGSREPSFSPDGAWLAFSRNGQVQKVPVGGGPATVLADSSNASAASWSPDGAFLIYTKSNDGLWRVSASGGAAERVTTMDTARREFNHWAPQYLPGGKAVIYTSYASPIARARIEAVDFATGRRRVLVDGAVFGRYAASGYLLYARDAAVFAVRFDPATLEIKGTAVPVLEDVAWLAPDGVAGYAVSPNGTLAYLKQSEWRVERRVVWTDRAGNEEPALPARGTWAEPRLSPDGRWIALTQAEPKRDLWLFDRGRRALTQLTRAPAAAFNALWTLDSRSLIYTFEDPVYELHRIPIDASRPDAVVFTSPYDKRATGISPDGRSIVFTESVDRDLLGIVPLTGGTASRVDDRPASQRAAMFSPDGRWLVYDEANRDEQPQVYIRPVDGRTGRIQVSTSGGNQPRWSRGGREIVYRRGDAMLASAFDPGSGEVGATTPLFSKADAGQLDARSYGYDVTPDGSRFLLVTPIERPEATPTHVILNWFGELQRKAGS